MATLLETAEWIEGIYQLETSDPVEGGQDGIDNRQAKQLAARTKWLKAFLAPLASPALTGTPTAPTPALGTNTIQLANTAFVQATIAALVASSPAALDTLSELAAALGNDANFATTITNALALKATLASPTFTGDPKAPTASKLDKDTSLATTQFFWDNEPSVAGLVRKLKIASQGINNYSSVITADALVLRNVAQDQHVRLTGVNVTGNINGTVGAVNGLDANSLAASTKYHLFVIYNPTTLAAGALYSLSETAPTLPAGYTFFARVGSVRTDASGSKYLLQLLQTGRLVQYVPLAGSNVTALPTAASATSATGGTAIAVGNYVPTDTATRIYGTAYLSNAANGQWINVAPNAAYTFGATHNVPVGFYNSNTAGINAALPFDFELESTNIYWGCSTGGTSRIDIRGWEENL